MHDKIHYEDYEIGEVFQSPRRTLTEADVVMYSMFSGDWDRRTAADGTWLVPEMFSFSLGLCLLLSAGRYAWMAKSFIAFYGFDEITIERDLPVGSTISSRVEVVDLVERDETRGIIVFVHQTLDQDGKVVCASRHRVLLARAPQTATAATA
jgi:3-hydroxybutyryl-CoA dehydratase